MTIETSSGVVFKCFIFIYFLLPHRASVMSSTRRTPQELAAVDEKIQALEESIISIEEKKAAILAPKPPRKPRKTKKQKIADILKKAQKSGMKPDEIAAALGIEMEE